MFDIARFMIISVDGEVRRGVHDEIIDVYYETLVSESDKVEITKEQVKRKRNY